VKNIDEIKKELLAVEFALRTTYKEDQRIPMWKGYRSALLFVLDPSDSKSMGIQGNK